MDNNKQLKKNYIFSMRIDKQQHKLLKDNPQIKKEINELVFQYINIYIKHNS